MTYRDKAEVPVYVEKAPMNSDEKELRMTKVIAFSLAGTIMLLIAAVAGNSIVDRVAPVHDVPAPPSKVEVCHDSIEVVPWGTKKTCEVGGRLTVTNLNNGTVVVGCACGAP